MPMLMMNKPELIDLKAEELPLKNEEKQQSEVAVS